MKKIFLICTAALFVTSCQAPLRTAHAYDNTYDIRLGVWDCPGIGKVEYHKYAVHALGFTTVKGKEIENDQLRGISTEYGEVITFKGKRCRKVN